MGAAVLGNPRIGKWYDNDCGLIISIGIGARSSCEPKVLLTNGRVDDANECPSRLPAALEQAALLAGEGRPHTHDSVESSKMKGASRPTVAKESLFVRSRRTDAARGWCCRRGRRARAATRRRRGRRARADGCGSR